MPPRFGQGKKATEDRSSSTMVSVAYLHTLKKQYEVQIMDLDKRLATDAYEGEEGIELRKEHEQQRIVVGLNHDNVERLLQEVSVPSELRLDDSPIQPKRRKKIWELGKPPKTAQFLVCLFIPKAERDNRLGDLQEEFEAMKKRCGPSYAWCQYWLQVGTTIGPLVKERAFKAANWLVKLGAGAGINEILHRLYK